MGTEANRRIWNYGSHKRKTRSHLFSNTNYCRKYGDEIIEFTGGEFHLYDTNDKKWAASFVGYGDSELTEVKLEQNKAVTVTTQFDIPYDEEMTYRVGIVPNRFGMEQTTEIAFNCIKNCNLLLEE